MVDEKDYPGVPIFRASGFSGEYWSSYLGITNPLPISDELNEIFDKGNETHHQDEILNAGAKGIISIEDRITILHESEAYMVSGQHDYVMMHYKPGGLYIKDLKSTTSGGLFYFFRKGIENGYKIQMSIYSFLYYIKHGVWINTGAIEKIDKENFLNRIQLSVELYDKISISKYIENHPNILIILGKITETKFLKIAADHLKDMDEDYKSGKKDKPWCCDKCQYLCPKGVECTLLTYIKEGK